MWRAAHAKVRAYCRERHASATPSELPRVPNVMKLPRYLVVLPLIAVVGPIIGADVLTNWKEHCAKCHGDDGKGETKMGRKLSIRDLSDASVQSKFTDEDALKAIKEGVKDKAGKVTMKPIENLAAEDMPPLVKHVRGLVKK